MKDSFILIPSYEPDHTLVDLAKSLKEIGFNILIVNDGSNRSYDEVFLEAAKFATYILYETNRGKGYALKYGYKYTYDNYKDIKYVITVDGDGQHSLKDIKRVYEALLTSNKPVIGVRKFDKNTPPKSKFGNDLSKFTRSWLTKQYLQDDQCGLRGFPLSYIPSLLKISGNRYGYEMNQIVKLQMMHVDLVTVEIETIYIKQNNGTHFLPMRDTLRIQSHIFINAIPAIICNIILATLFLIAFHYSNIPHFGIVYLAYLISTSFYLLLLNIIYPVASISKQLIKETISMVIKSSLAALLSWVFIDTLGLSSFLFIPIVFILSFINVPFAIVIDKIRKK